MAANIFKIIGERVETFDEFMRLEKENKWSDLLYYSDEFNSGSEKYITFDNKLFNSISFKDTVFYKVRFIRCKFEGCIFMGATFNECEFIDCVFKNTNANKIKVNSCLIDPKCFDENFDLKSDTNIAVNVYQSLYKNASREYQSEHALYSLYKMKNAEYHHLSSRLDRGIITKAQYYKKRMFYCVHDFISGYGLKTLKVLRLLIIFIIAFSSVNYFFSESIFKDGVDFTIINSIYFTCVTMTTLGYGDITPYTDFGKILVTLQALFGFIVLSLFMASVINRAVKVV
jgi:hypothetical protein